MLARSLVLPAVLLCSVVALAEAEKDRPRTKTNVRVSECNTMLVMDEAEYWREVSNAQLERERYTGTRVVPEADTESDAARLRTQVGEAIAKAEIVPEARLQRFQWIPRAQGTKITGWSLEVLETSTEPHGIVAKVRVRPLHSGNAGLRTTDYAIETYLVSNREVLHLGTTFPTFGGIVTFN